MIYLKLFLSFLKIGFFNFGGGYAMISLIEKEITAHHWLTTSEFINIIAVSQITPGAIAVNTASFVGYRVAGFWGAVVATLAIPIPSLLLVMVISHYLDKFKEQPLITMIFYGIRPVIVGLIVYAAILVSLTSVFQPIDSTIGWIDRIKAPLQLVNWGSILILIITLVGLIKYKINPILAIIGSGILGMIVFSFISF